MPIVTRRNERVRYDEPDLERLSGTRDLTDQAHYHAHLLTHR